MSKPPRDTEQLELIRQALAGLKFGEIVIAIHDGEIVQIARTEKLRPPRSPDRA
jgi:hypothetical protein